MVNPQAVARTLAALATISPTSTSSTIATSSAASSTITGVPPGESGLTELDVLFPQPNKIYPQVSPFPVVFAIQNPQVVYSYEFVLDWLIFLDNCTETNLTYCELGSEAYSGRISNRDYDTDFPIPASIGAGPIFPFDIGPGSRSLGTGVWQMIWRYYLRELCEASETSVDQYVQREIGSGTFLFTLASTASPTNPLSSVCPTSAVLVSILGSVTMGPEFALTFSNCPTTAKSPPSASATPCSATLDAAAASSVLNALNASVVTPTVNTTHASAASQNNSLLGIHTSAIVLVSVLGLLFS